MEHALTKRTLSKDEAAILINDKFNSIRDMVLQKNDLYGNAALDPTPVFSTSSAVERLRARIDEKISRYRNNKEGDKESPLVDLVGSLVLLIIAEEMEDAERRSANSIGCGTESQIKK